MIKDYYIKKSSIEMDRFQLYVMFHIEYDKKLNIYY